MIRKPRPRRGLLGGNARETTYARNSEDSDNRDQVGGELTQIAASSFPNLRPSPRSPARSPVSARVVAGAAVVMVPAGELGESTFLGVALPFGGFPAVGLGEGASGPGYGVAVLQRWGRGSGRRGRVDLRRRLVTADRVG
jgi:hypothetical protein